ncbi:MAG: hypothetical protein U0U69_03075 [Acidimicrobiia bacterium]
MQPEDYVPRHSKTGVPPATSPARPPDRRRRQRRPRRVLVVIGGVLVGVLVLAVGVWLALGSQEDPGVALAGFCESADAYPDPAAKLPDDPDGVRDLVARRVEASALVARNAPEEIRGTAAAHAADMEASRGVFEKYGYSPHLLDQALGGGLSSPEDVAAVLRILGYSYSGDVAGDRAGQLAAYSTQHCRSGTG